MNVPGLFRSTECFLAAYGVHERGPMPPCDGALVRCHLLPRQLLKRTWREVHHGSRRQKRRELPWRHLEDLLVDPATWVPGCGGPSGAGGHHGMLDVARTLRIPRGALPDATEEAARTLGLVAWLEREYGELVSA